MTTVHVITPNLNPRGGVIKLFDYVGHCRALGHDVRLYSPDWPEPMLALFSIDRVAAHLDDPGVVFTHGVTPEVHRDDLVLFTWPRDYITIAGLLPADFDLRRVVHLLQSTQHVNPAFNRGYGRRLLRQPISRIAVSDPVARAVAEIVHRDSLLATIPEGHDWPYFAKPRTGGFTRPVTVGYTAWKSRVGDEVARLLADRDDIVFNAQHSEATWPQLRELYHRSDIFLGTPAAEEGFYMVGYEAMAAGAILIIADAGGNRAYCHFGENCIEAGLDDAAAHVEAVEQLLAAGDDAIVAMRQAAYGAVAGFDLAGERASFAEFLDQIESQ